MSLTVADATRLETCLAGDGVAVVPTDTVYGLACNPESEVALRRIYELKGRPPAKPAAVLFFALEAALESLPELGPRTHAALEALLPGALTVLLSNPERRFPLACDPLGEGSGSLGLRVPVLSSSLAVLGVVRVPIAQSSANLSGGADSRDLRDVPVEVCEGADLVLDGGELPGRASTVVDLSDFEQSGRWRVVREGPVTHSALERLLR